MEQNESRLTVAIVDDDEYVLDSVKTVLDDQPWLTQTYASGEDFLSDLKHHKFDCIILDANLPGLSALAVANMISNEHEKTPPPHPEDRDFNSDSQNTIPIIVLTAYPDSSQAMKIKQLGVRDILVKPVTAKVLIEHIAKIVKPIEVPKL